MNINASINTSINMSINQILAVLARRLAALLLLWFAVLPVQAAEALKSESDVKAFTERVMNAVGRGMLEAAYDAVKKHAVLSATDLDAAAQGTRTQRAAAAFGARYGKTVGYDFIGTRKLGTSMLRFTYIEKTEQHPLPWVFHFYRTDRGWVLSEFGWDGNAAALYLVED